jgi:uncharacterized membrane protein YhaH (DUF805 family)
MLQTAFVFYGRERRQVFWSATLTNFGITLICILFCGSIKTISWIAYIYVLITIVPQIAITVRRLHDVNSSGKKLFLLLIPIVGLVFITIELTFDSIPESNMYGESLKYPKDNKVILSPDAVDKSKLHNKDSQDTTEELPLEDTPTEDTDNAIK